MNQSQGHLPLVVSASLFLTVAGVPAQSWQPTASYPLAVYQADMAEYNGKLYVAGGLDAAPVATVSVGTISPDGSVTAWTPTSPLPLPNLPGLAAYNGWVYAVLSNGAVCRSRILPGGALDNWTIEPEAVDPSNAYSTVLKEYRGVLYLFGRWASAPAAFAAAPRSRGP